MDPLRFALWIGTCLALTVLAVWLISMYFDRKARRAKAMRDKAIADHKMAPAPKGFVRIDGVDYHESCFVSSYPGPRVSQLKLVDTPRPPARTGESVYETRRRENDERRRRDFDDTPQQSAMATQQSALHSHPHERATGGSHDCSPSHSSHSSHSHSDSHSSSYDSGSSSSDSGSSCGGGGD